MYYTKILLVVTLLVSFLTLSHSRLLPPDHPCTENRQCRSNWCDVKYTKKCTCKAAHASCISYPNGCEARNCCSGLIAYDPSVGHNICNCLWRREEKCTSDRQCCSNRCNKAYGTCFLVESNKPCWDPLMCISNYCENGYCN